MVGQKDNSKAVSTKALMTVFHPQDVENLDPKMVGPRFLLISSTFQIMPLIQLNILHVRRNTTGLSWFAVFV